MARWQEIESAEPEFAARLKALLDAHRHKILATLRRDGSPRVSGIEIFFQDGDLWFGSMPGSRKVTDLARDPRIAIHSSSDDPPADPTQWRGDAKLAGRAMEVDDPERLRSMGDPEQNGGEDLGGHLYRVDITEATWTGMGDPPDHLAVQLWTPAAGLRHLRTQ